ncbi:MAG: hypothetical protein OXC60_07920 [Litoreibacter sp.]|nr:hypothetical protein [Litoreibacter sp.]MCY4334585.1 hypothetical protein [Litoreibacter sp.]
MKAVIIFFTLFICLASLLFWAKMKPANAAPLSPEFHRTVTQA